MTLDVKLLYLFNGLAGKSRIFDTLVVFLAEYLQYILVAAFIVLLYFSVYSRREKFYIFGVTTFKSLTATLPNVFERILTFFVKQGEKEEDDLLYHDTGLADFIVNGSTKTKVSVEGIVDKVAHEPDGDYHVIIRPQYVPAGLFLVTEFIPEIKDLPLPKEGGHIKIWGITRFDEPHNWWEIHPVIGWQKL